MTDEVGITIIGAGVIGCAVAYEISRTYNGDIAVVEKNPKVAGENQSSRNSGVVHSGIYYPLHISPWKAQLCVDGNRLLYDFCSKYNLPCKNTGKLVVATEDLELEYLDDAAKIAEENGVEGIKFLSGGEAKKYEPNVRAISALYVPSSGIIEPTGFVEKLSRLAEGNGVIFLTGNKVEGIIQKRGLFNLTINSGKTREDFNTAICINCAGLYSDIVAKMVNPESLYEMDPVKGDSAKFYCSKRENISINGHNIYPVPFGYYPDGERARVPFKEFKRLSAEFKVARSVGVHLSPTFDPDYVNKSILNSGGIGSTVTLGPAYSRPESREDYKNARDTEYFYNMVKPFFPNIEPGDISPHQTGIRARLKNCNDFVIENDPLHNNFINLIGIDSPGLTSSLAIAKYVANMVKELL